LLKKRVYLCVFFYIIPMDDDSGDVVPHCLYWRACADVCDTYMCKLKFIEFWLIHGNLLMLTFWL